MLPTYINIYIIIHYYVYRGPHMRPNIWGLSHD